MPPQAVDANGRLTIVNLRPEDAGDYVCQAISPAGTFEAVARLDVDFSKCPVIYLSLWLGLVFGTTSCNNRSMRTDIGNKRHILS